MPDNRLAELDRWQAVAVYFAPRDRKGNVVATGRRPAVSEREEFCRFWRGKALPRWRVERLWAEGEAERAEVAARLRRRPGETRDQVKGRRLAEVRAVRAKARGG